MYLPSLVHNGSLKMNPEWAQKLQNKYCDNQLVYQLYKRENGNYLDVYHMGLSFVQAPSFFIAHGIAQFTSYPKDGMSKPYQIAFVLNAWLFALLGWYYIRKLLLVYSSELTTSILTFVCLLGTNYWITSTISYSLQHLYLFALITAFSYHLLTSFQDNKVVKRKLIYSAFLLGLIVAIRPTHLLLAVLPFVFLRFKRTLLPNWKTQLVLFGVIGFLCALPQMLYWKLVANEWIVPNMHLEEVVLIDPNISDFLFSYRKGWVLYSPVFFLLIVSIWSLFKKDKTIAWIITTTLFLAIWIFASWECWWYAASFGQRVMVDLYGLFFLAIAIYIECTTSKSKKIVVWSFIGLCTCLSFLQSEQFLKGILHSERMTKEQYCHIFGKTTVFDNNPARLLIDRNDLEWTSYFENHLKLGHSIKTKRIYSTTKELFCAPTSNLDINHFELLKLFDNDETLIEVFIEYEVTDTLHSAMLKMEVASKFNCYQWNNTELALHKPKKNKLFFSFNLPTVHHQKDYLQVYITNEGNHSIRIHKLEIEGKTLIR